MLCFGTWDGINKKVIQLCRRHQKLTLLKMMLERKVQLVYHEGVRCKSGGNQEAMREMRSCLLSPQSHHWTREECLEMRYCFV